MALKRANKQEGPKIDKMFILSHLDDTEIDLSMCNLTQVPVKELAMISRGTRLDLSRNLFTVLPDKFGILKHIMDLDLSSNHITVLPDSFGYLILLQKLDLYSNELATLPLTFWQLRKLKWLDVRNNKLEETLAEAAGPCVTDAECKQCASKVLLYMKNKASEVERQRQLHLRKTRDEEKRLAEEELHKQEEAKRQKIEALKRRKLSRQEEERKAKISIYKEEKEKAEFLKNEQAIGKQVQVFNKNSTSILCRLLIKMAAFAVLLLLLVLILAPFYCNRLSGLGGVCSVWKYISMKMWSEPFVKTVGF